ncbi:MAG: hypothetical protein KatS3mg035_2064 [Bacteroidia bacterium]|nr:MAG: hypothetical protein KatS3mg035_2064 [Bacteroidia bacterium]
MKNILFTLLMIVELINLKGLLAQSQNRTASKTSVNKFNSIAAEPRLQASLNQLTESLKFEVNAPQNKLADLLFSESEFSAIYEQTYGISPGEKDKAIFQKKKSDVISLLNNFRDPNLQTQILNVVERSGDNSLRAMVVTVKFTHQNLNKIAKLVMIKYNQNYKIMMLDE